MHELNDIHPVADFNRNTDEYVRRLKETGKPEILSVNGRAEIVVQSAEAYQRLLDAVDLAESCAAADNASPIRTDEAKNNRPKKRTLPACMAVSNRFKEAPGSRPRANPGAEPGRWL